jgi:H+-translocating NAD(P) transhydrogenase subunit alpha
LLTVLVLNETRGGETRVALVPETIARLTKAGLAVTVEAGAGEAAGFPDALYLTGGASVASDRASLLARADVLLAVQPPPEDVLAALKPGALVLGFLRPAQDGGRFEAMAARGVYVFALERLPRTSRAQKMDALSSMSTVAGYRAVLLAAARLPRFFPLLMTAAGTIPPARVFVLGAGVAGLTAIATARRLGAVVEAFDVRPAVREEVESLGATFVHAHEASPGAAAPPNPIDVELGGTTLSVPGASGSGAYASALSESAERAERALLARHVAGADVVITTAVVPDRKAPLLITGDMVAAMRPGAVIVDLAAESGGNCELTRAGEDVLAHGVHVLGPVNLPAGLPGHASQMLSRNLSALLLHLVKDGAPALDFTDDITAGACVARPTGAPA